MKGGGGDSFPPLSFVGPGKDEEARKEAEDEHRRGASNAIYENVPRRILREVEEEATYDVPRMPRRLPPLPPGGLLPTAARLVLMGVGDCRSRNQEEPDIPSPDYGSDGEESEDSYCGEENYNGDFNLDDGHYYVEEQGLEVILEESEEEKANGEDEILSENRTSSSNSYDAMLHLTIALNTANKFLWRELQKEDTHSNESSTPDFEKKYYQTEESIPVNNCSDLEKNHKNIEEEREESPKKQVSSEGMGRNASKVAECVSNGEVKPTVEPSKSTSNSEVNKNKLNEEKVEVTEKISTINLRDGLDEYIACPRISTVNWNPGNLMDKLYHTLPNTETNSNTHKYTNISGVLEKLPSGRKKATFWNAWKSRYFKAENGYLYCYQKASSETPISTIQLMGGKIEVLKPIGMDENQMRNCTLLGIDDGKGHYMVVKCSNEADANAWHTALLTQVEENYEATYVNPVSIIDNPSIMKDTIVIDLGSCSLRAGILSSQPSLPQIFFPSIMAVHKETNEKRYGLDAMSPDIRLESRLSFPIRPSAKIAKYSVNLEGFYGLIEQVFKMLAVQPQGYNIFLCVPRSFNSYTLSNITNTMFEKWKAKSLSISHQSVLTLYAYNARSGIVVDIGERTDVIPISEGYILERGVTRTPYGSYQIVEKLRQILLEKNLSFVTDVESYLLRYIMENGCYCAQDYTAELNDALNDPKSIKKEISIKDVYCDSNLSQKIISLDLGRFQASEGLFNPEMWGHDNMGVHKMVHKAVQECSVDIRKEMVRNIFVSGGVTMLPGFTTRLVKEVDQLTPPAITPKVHASPHRYHAAYIGATVLANSNEVSEITVKRQEWMKSSVDILRKWNI